MKHNHLKLKREKAILPVDRERGKDKISFNAEFMHVHAAAVKCLHDPSLSGNGFLNNDALDSVIFIYSCEYSQEYSILPLPHVNTQFQVNPYFT
jgi:hypothetical protein